MCSTLDRIPVSLPCMLLHGLAQAEAKGKMRLFPTETELGTMGPARLTMRLKVPFVSIHLPYLHPLRSAWVPSVSILPGQAELA